MARVLISLPDELLERIDAEVERRDTNRSALLRQLAERELRVRDPGAAHAAIERMRARAAGAPAFDAADAVRKSRDELDRRAERHAQRGG
jgi:hypothetical protein